MTLYQIFKKTVQLLSKRGVLDSSLQCDDVFEDDWGNETENTDKISFSLPLFRNFEDEPRLHIALVEKEDGIYLENYDKEAMPKTKLKINKQYSFNVRPKTLANKIEKLFIDQDKERSYIIPIMWER